MDIAELGIKVDSTGATKAVTDLDKLTGAAVRAEGAATKVGAASVQASGGMSKGSYQAKLMAQQLSQVAQQSMATGNFVQALAIQLPDMALGFGAVGIAAGVVAGVALPLLASAFQRGSGGAKDLGTATTEAADAIDVFRAAVANAGISTDDLKAKFGASSGEIKRAYDLIASLKADEAQRGIDGLSASLAALWGAGGGGDARTGVAAFFDANIFMAFTAAGKEAMGQARELTAEFVNQQSALANSNGDLNAQLSIMTEMVQTANALALADGSVSEAEQQLITQIQNALGLVADQVALTRELESGVRDVVAAGFDARLILAQSTATTETFVTALQDAATAAGDIAQNAPGAGWLSGAISDAATLGTTLWDAAAAKAALANADPNAGPDFENKGRGRSKLPPSTAKPTFDQLIARDTPKGGSSGGGATDDFASRLKTLQDNLMTERQTVDAWYAEGQKILADRRSLEILGAQGHKDALLAIEKSYHDKVAEIQDAAREQRLGATASMFGALAGIAEAGGKKQAKLAATLAAIETTVNGYATAMSAARQAPTLAGKIAAYAGWIATTAKAVSAIRSAGGTGGGGVGGGVAAQGAATGGGAQQAVLSIAGLGRDRSYTGAELEAIFDGVLDVAKVRGMSFPGVVFV